MTGFLFKTRLNYALIGLLAQLVEHSTAYVEVRVCVTGQQVFLASPEASMEIARIIHIILSHGTRAN